MLMTKDNMSDSPMPPVEKSEQQADVRTVEREGLKFSFRHSEEFDAIYQAVFKDKEYDFTTDNPAPRILDAGSHIGVATMFFKTRYPAAQVTCFEPSPVTFPLLQRNIAQNGLEGVTLVNAALASQRGETSFYVENPQDGQVPYTWGDSAAKNKWVEEDPAAYKTIPVQTTVLSDYLDEPVDLLKLDVEGSEANVLAEAGKKLQNVQQIFMEFHGSSTNPDNESARVLELLKKNGFTYEITQDGIPVDEQDIRRDDPYWLIIHASRKG